MSNSTFDVDYESIHTYGTKIAVMIIAWIYGFILPTLHRVCINRSGLICRFAYQTDKQSDKQFDQSSAEQLPVVPIIPIIPIVPIVPIIPIVPIKSYQQADIENDVSHLEQHSDDWKCCKLNTPPIADHPFTMIFFGILVGCCFAILGGCFVDLVEYEVFNIALFFILLIITIYSFGKALFGTPYSRI
jgi:hypothetical protein